MQGDLTPQVRYMATGQEGWWSFVSHVSWFWFLLHDTLSPTLHFSCVFSSDFTWLSGVCCCYFLAQLHFFTFCNFYWTWTRRPCSVPLWPSPTPSSPSVQKANLLNNVIFFLIFFHFNLHVTQKLLWIASVALSAPCCQPSFSLPSSRWASWDQELS